MYWAVAVCPWTWCHFELLLSVWTWTWCHFELLLSVHGHDVILSCWCLSMDMMSFWAVAVCVDMDMMSFWAVAVCPWTWCHFELLLSVHGCDTVLNCCSLSIEVMLLDYCCQSIEVMLCWTVAVSPSTGCVELLLSVCRGDVVLNSCCLSVEVMLCWTVAVCL